MREENCEFFLDSQLRPTVKIPDDGFQQEWSVDSQRMEDYITSGCYESTQEQIRSSERKFLMALLREECRKGGRRLSQVEVEQTDKDVIIQAALYIMDKSEFFSGRTVDLLEKCCKIQAADQISSTEDIPAFTNIFSRRLSRLIPALKGYGISVVLDHKEDGSYCTLQRLDSFQMETTADDSSPVPSGKSSGVNTSNGKDLAPTDDSDGKIRFDQPHRTTKMVANSNGTTLPPNSDEKGGA